jgi:hypothetical protein
MSSLTHLSGPRLHATMGRHLRAPNMTTVESYLAWCRQNGFGLRISKTLPQRQEEIKTSQRVKAKKQTQENLDEHIEALELTTVDTYQSWCLAHRFGDGLHKSRTPRQQELRHAAKMKVQTRSSRAAVYQHKRRRKETMALIEAGQIDELELTSPVLLRVHFLCQQVIMDPVVKDAFLKLLIHTEKHGGLFHIKPVISQYGHQAENTFVDALAALAHWHPLWVRDVEAWQPSSHNDLRQFGSLARHLLAHYDLPVCMDTAWFRGMENEAQPQQEWFIHIGLGQNIRKAAVPFRYSKQMAHVLLTMSPKITP